MSRLVFLSALVFFVAACGSSDAGDGADNPTDTGDAALDVTDDGPTGAGTVTGSADGSPFSSAGGALLIGAPDSASTTVVFLFSKPVHCSALASPGWDRRIDVGTQILELRMFGTSPGTFRAVTTTTPAPGEASVNYALSSTAPPIEITAASGGVTLTTLTPNAVAGGSFDLRFGGNALSGTFDAAFCLAGHEP